MKPKRLRPSIPPGKRSRRVKYLSRIMKRGIPIVKRTVASQRGDRAVLSQRDHAGHSDQFAHRVPRSSEFFQLRSPFSPPHAFHSPRPTVLGTITAGRVAYDCGSPWHEQRVRDRSCAQSPSSPLKARVYRSLPFLAATGTALLAVRAPFSTEDASPFEVPG